ncbi:MAG: hypothetical protein IPK26_03050 [Planctomycetes bacterium]|nr:hypothetical protein [Planctomycetota bacterium]
MESAVEPSATPLSAFTPLALSGCDLLATPDSVQFLAMAGGAVEWNQTIPNSSSWTGAVLHQQLAQFDPAAPSSLSSSNALTLVLGTF